MEETKVKFKIHYNKKYRIKNPSKHFKDKYGEECPVITMLERDTEVFGVHWHEKMSTPAVLAFMLRVLHDNNRELDYKSPAYYGKIFTKGLGGLGEIVYKNELEPI